MKKTELEETECIYPEKPEDFIQNILNKMVAKKSDIHPNRIFYCIGNIWYFSLLDDIDERKNDFLWCNYYYLWTIISIRYNINHYDRYILIRTKVSKHLDCEVGEIINTHLIINNI